jgi:hypothetical protein
MKNDEILRRRAELKAQANKIKQEWEDYDKRYPVLPGAYKPPDYDRQQRQFLDRLRAVSNELSALPRTTGEMLRRAFTWIVIVAVIALAIVLLL